MHAWLHALQRILTHGDAAVLVTVARAEGSAPRAAGTRMIVSREHVLDSVGGGDMERAAIDTARRMLKDTSHREPRRLERIALGAALGRAGGGVVTLAFERLTVADLAWVVQLVKRVGTRQATVRSVSFGATQEPVMLSAPQTAQARPDCLLWESPGLPETGPLLTETIAPQHFDIFIFGAGHVGTALTRVLSSMPYVIDWVDPRAAQFPDAPAPNVRIDVNGAPESVIGTAAQGSYFAVLTHSHALDQTLAEVILRRGDHAYFGMIGSLAKRRQFEHRLASRGIDPAQFERMVCPIGLPDIADKSPAAIAIGIAAQMLAAMDRHAFPPAEAEPAGATDHGHG